jgi:hypothetical protein
MLTIKLLQNGNSDVGLAWRRECRAPAVIVDKFLKNRSIRSLFRRVSANIITQQQRGMKYHLRRWKMARHVAPTRKQIIADHR